MCYQVNAKGVHLGTDIYWPPLGPFCFCFFPTICTVLLPFRLCIYNSVAGFFLFFSVMGRLGRELASARGSLVVVPCPVVVLLYEDKRIFFFFLVFKPPFPSLLDNPVLFFFVFSSRTKVSSSLCRSLPKWRYPTGGVTSSFFQFSSSLYR
jgi:hypothetical protein